MINKVSNMRIIKQGDNWGSCEVCYAPLKKHQRRFCFSRCRSSWHKKNNTKHYKGNKIIREFKCSGCGIDVIVSDKADRRKNFCSNICSRKYFRKKYKSPSRTLLGGAL